MTPMDLLRELRAYAGERQTVGLEDSVIERFLLTHPKLAQAIREAHAAHLALRAEWGAALAGSEAELVVALQVDYVNFYQPDTVNPYVPLAARGPWVVTSHGAVLHDSGGYGMLGHGHGPDAVLEAMAQPWVQANIMTPSFSQKRLADRLRREVGQTRGGCPFTQFVCVNSGSESMTVAMRITDINALTQTRPGGRHAGKKVKFIALKGAFHGRTNRPSEVSDSSMPKYRQHLRSFQDRDTLITVTPNSVEELQAAFDQADRDGVFVEAMFLEPVMGEGNPGQLVSRAFYDLARKLTVERDSLLVVDSIQAGLRGTGYLSIVDYPGFQDAGAPDMETWSKAINAGQYPLSVLGCGPRAADLYVRGVYGNTMTTNPRALEVGITVLDSLTPELRANIREKGLEFVRKLEALRAEFPNVVTSVRGTGLLLAAEIDPAVAQVVGFDGLETFCRRHGIGVIHGGKNALRFTPHFGITSEEIDLTVQVVRQSIRSQVELAALETATARERLGAM